MNFEDALIALRNGRRPTREAWDDPKCIATLENEIAGELDCGPGADNCVGRVGK